jgi:hypothetical protein
MTAPIETEPSNNKVKFLISRINAPNLTTTADVIINFKSEITYAPLDLKGLPEGTDYSILYWYNEQWNVLDAPSASGDHVLINNNVSGLSWNPLETFECPPY